MAPAPSQGRARTIWTLIALVVATLALHGRTAGARFLGGEDPNPLQPFSVHAMAATSVEHVLAVPRVEGDEPLARIAHRAAWSIGARRAPDARRFDAWLLAAAAALLFLALATRLPRDVAAFAAFAFALSPSAADAVAFADARGWLVGSILGAAALLLVPRGTLARLLGTALALLAVFAQPTFAALAVAVALFDRSGSRPRSGLRVLRSIAPLLLLSLAGIAWMWGGRAPSAGPALGPLLLGAVPLLLILVLLAAPLPKRLSAPGLEWLAAGGLWVLTTLAFGWFVPPAWNGIERAVFLALPGEALAMAGLWRFLSYRIPGLARGALPAAVVVLLALVPATETRRGQLRDNTTLAAALEARTPESPRPALVRAREELRHGQLTAARASFEEANRRSDRADGTTDQGTADAWTGLAILDIRIPRLDSAQALLERALALAPDDVVANQRIGELFQRRGDQSSLVRAIEHLRRATEGAPFFLRARTRLAVCLALLGRTEEAEAAADWALTIDPEAREAWLARGMAAEGERDPAAARSAYEHALICEPDYAEALVSLGRLQRDAGELDAAAATLERAFELHPLYPDVLYQGALTWRELGDLESAESFYRKTLAARPGHMRATVELGGVLLDQGRPMEARDEARAALQKNPNHPGARELLGEVALALGDWSGAASQFEIALRASPGRRDLAVRIVRLLATAPDDTARDGARALAEARRLLAEAGDRDPELLAALAAAQAETGDFTAAERTVQRALGLLGAGESTQRETFRAERESYRAHEPLRLGEPR